VLLSLTWAYVAAMPTSDDAALLPLGVPTHHDISASEVAATPALEKVTSNDGSHTSVASLSQDTNAQPHLQALPSPIPASDKVTLFSSPMSNAFFDGARNRKGRGRLHTKEELVWLAWREFVGGDRAQKGERTSQVLAAEPTAREGMGTEQAQHIAQAFKAFLQQMDANTTGEKEATTAH